MALMKIRVPCPDVQYEIKPCNTPFLEKRGLLSVCLFRAYLVTIFCTLNHVKTRYGPNRPAAAIGEGDFWYGLFWRPQRLL